MYTLILSVISPFGFALLCFTLHTKRSFVRRNAPCKAELCMAQSIPFTFLQSGALYAGRNPFKPMRCIQSWYKAELCMAQEGMRLAKRSFAWRKAFLAKLTKLRFVPALHGALQRRKAKQTLCVAPKAHPLAKRSFEWVCTGNGATQRTWLTKRSFVRFAPCKAELCKECAMRCMGKQSFVCKAKQT